LTRCSRLLWGQYQTRRLLILAWMRMISQTVGQNIVYDIATFKLLILFRLKRVCPQQAFFD
jgi:hypothetical protein